MTRIAILGESEADEEALCILLGAAIGSPVEPVKGPPLRTRGWPAVLEQVPVVMRHLSFRTEATGLVVLVDADRSPPHDPGGCDPACRRCLVTEKARRKLERERALGTRPARGAPLRFAAGLAVPSLESWLLCGRTHDIGEAQWRLVDPASTRHRQMELKRRVYGTDRPSLEREVEAVRREAQRIVDDGKIDLLQELFPGGFGVLVKEVAGW